ncbi:MAG: hypothetical protein AAB665_01750 [Patescibacteria group bacterium]
MRRDDNAADKDKTLDAAEQKLSGIKGRPLEVGKILAQNRAKEEHDRAMQKKAEAKLEATHKAARERANELRTEKLESENKVLEEKQKGRDDGEKA